MSDTPRTDRAVAFDDDGHVVTASFARSLERELNELNQAVDGLCKLVGAIPGNVVDLAVQVGRLVGERNAGRSAGRR